MKTNAIKAKQTLASYGFTQSVDHSRQLIIVLLTTGFCALLAWVLGVFWTQLKKVNSANLKEIFSINWDEIVSTKWEDLTSFTWSSAVSLGVAIVVYQQWRLARYEISIDKYYDRLDTANKRLEFLRTNYEDRFNMLVFAELDKLEYVIYKYDLGFISPILAARAVDNFKRWCLVKESWKTDNEMGEYKFRRWATDWVNNAGYDPKTRIIVENIRKECGPVTGIGA